MTNYISEFYNVYGKERTFAVAMFKHLSETNLLHAKYLDDYLTYLIKNVLFKSSETIIFLMSDYGALPDKVRSACGKSCLILSLWQELSHHNFS